MRCGSALTSVWLGGESVYYGSVDATPLFVTLLGELQRWRGASAEIDRAPARGRPRAGLDREMATATATVSWNTSERPNAVWSTRVGKTRGTG